MVASVGAILTTPVFMAVQHTRKAFRPLRLRAVLESVLNYSRCPVEDENELLALRRQKLESLQAKGARPFGAAFATSGTIAEVREKFAEGETLRAAGRMTAHRDMGKSHFIDLRDSTGRIQAYVQTK